LGCEQKKHTKFAKCLLVNAFGFGLINDHHIISLMGKTMNPTQKWGYIFFELLGHTNSITLNTLEPSQPMPISFFHDSLNPRPLDSSKHLNIKAKMLLDVEETLIWSTQKRMWILFKPWIT
jgi:hypothetical protein